MIKVEFDMKNVVRVNGVIAGELRLVKKVWAYFPIGSKVSRLESVSVSLLKCLVKSHLSDSIALMTFDDKCKKVCEILNNHSRSGKMDLTKLESDLAAINSKVMQYPNEKEDYILMLIDGRLMDFTFIPDPSCGKCNPFK